MVSAPYLSDLRARLLVPLDGDVLARLYHWAQWFLAQAFPALLCLSSSPGLPDLFMAWWRQ